MEQHSTAENQDLRQGASSNITTNKDDSDVNMSSSKNNNNSNNNKDRWTAQVLARNNPDNDNDKNPSSSSPRRPGVQVSHSESTQRRSNKSRKNSQGRRQSESNDPPGFYKPAATRDAAAAGAVAVAVAVADSTNTDVDTATATRSVTEQEVLEVLRSVASSPTTLTFLTEYGGSHKYGSSSSSSNNSNSSASGQDKSMDDVVDDKDKDDMYRTRFLVGQSTTESGFSNAQERAAAEAAAAASGSFSSSSFQKDRASMSDKEQQDVTETTVTLTSSSHDDDEEDLVIRQVSAPVTTTTTTAAAATRARHNIHRPFPQRPSTGNQTANRIDQDDDALVVQPETVDTTTTIAARTRHSIGSTTIWPVFPHTSDPPRPDTGVVQTLRREQAQGTTPRKKRKSRNKVGNNTTVATTTPTLTTAALPKKSFSKGSNNLPKTKSLSTTTAATTDTSAIATAVDGTARSSSSMTGTRNDGNEHSVEKSKRSKTNGSLNKNVHVTAAARQKQQPLQVVDFEAVVVDSPKMPHEGRRGKHRHTELHYVRMGTTAPPRSSFLSWPSSDKTSSPAAKENSNQTETRKKPKMSGRKTPDNVSVYVLTNAPESPDSSIGDVAQAPKAGNTSTAESPSHLSLSTTSASISSLSLSHDVDDDDCKKDRAVLEKEAAAQVVESICNNPNEIKRSNIKDAVETSDPTATPQSKAQNVEEMSSVYVFVSDKPQSPVSSVSGEYEHCPDSHRVHHYHQEARTTSSPSLLSERARESRVHGNSAVPSTDMIDTTSPLPIIEAKDTHNRLFTTKTVDDTTHQQQVRNDSDIPVDTIEGAGTPLDKTFALSRKGISPFPSTSVASHGWSTGTTESGSNPRAIDVTSKATKHKLRKKNAQSRVPAKSKSTRKTKSISPKHSKKPSASNQDLKENPTRRKAQSTPPSRSQKRQRSHHQEVSAVSSETALVVNRFAYEETHSPPRFTKKSQGRKSDVKSSETYKSPSNLHSSTSPLQSPRKQKSKKNKSPKRKQKDCPGPQDEKKSRRVTKSYKQDGSLSPPWTPRKVAIGSSPHRTPKSLGSDKAPVIIQLPRLMTLNRNVQEEQMPQKWSESQKESIPIVHATDARDPPGGKLKKQRKPRPGTEAETAKKTQKSPTCNVSIKDSVDKPLLLLDERKNEANSLKSERTFNEQPPHGQKRRTLASAPPSYSRSKNVPRQTLVKEAPDPIHASVASPLVILHTDKVYAPRAVLPLDNDIVQTKQRPAIIHKSEMQGTDSTNIVTDDSTKKSRKCQGKKKMLKNQSDPSSSKSTAMTKTHTKVKSSKSTAMTKTHTMVKSQEKSKKSPLDGKKETALNLPQTVHADGTSTDEATPRKQPNQLDEDYVSSTEKKNNRDVVDPSTATQGRKAAKILAKKEAKASEEECVDDTESMTEDREERSSECHQHGSASLVPNIAQFDPPSSVPFPREHFSSPNKRNQVDTKKHAKTRRRRLFELLCCRREETP